MHTLITRKTAKTSTSNARMGRALVRAGAANHGPAMRAMAHGEGAPPRFVAALLRALSAWAA